MNLIRIFESFHVLHSSPVVFGEQLVDLIEPLGHIDFALIRMFYNVVITGNVTALSYPHVS